MKHNKRDYSLYYMGLFDEKAGMFKMVGPEMIERGYEPNGNENSIQNNTDTD